MSWVRVYLSQNSTASKERRSQGQHCRSNWKQALIVISQLTAETRFRVFAMSPSNRLWVAKAPITEPSHEGRTTFARLHWFNFPFLIVSLFLRLTKMFLFFCSFIFFPVSYFLFYFSFASYFLIVYKKFILF